MIIRSILVCVITLLACSLENVAAQPQLPAEPNPVVNVPDYYYSSGMLPILLEETPEDMLVSLQEVLFQIMVYRDGVRQFQQDLNNSVTEWTTVVENLRSISAPAHRITELTGMLRIVKSDLRNVKGIDVRLSDIINIATRSIDLAQQSLWLQDFSAARSILAELTFEFIRLEGEFKGWQEIADDAVTDIGYLHEVYRDLNEFMLLRYQEVFSLFEMVGFAIWDRVAEIATYRDFIETTNDKLSYLQTLEVQWLPATLTAEKRQQFDELKTQYDRDKRFLEEKLVLMAGFINTFDNLSTFWIISLDNARIKIAEGKDEEARQILITITDEIDRAYRATPPPSIQVAYNYLMALDWGMAQIQNVFGGPIGQLARGGNL